AIRVPSGVHITVHRRHGDFLEAVRLEIVAAEPVSGAGAAFIVDSLVIDAALCHHLVDRPAVVVGGTQRAAAGAIEVNDPHAVSVPDVVHDQAVIVGKGDVVDMEVQGSHVAVSAGGRLNDADGGGNEVAPVDRAAGPH